jgi:O-antigen/teichoic acid export membrane protein
MIGDPEVRPPEQPRRTLGLDVLLTLGNKVGVLVLNVAGTIVVARTLGPTGRGSIAVAFALTLLLVQFGSLGFQSANPYFAARDPRRLGAIIANSVWLSVVVGTALVVVAILVRWQFPAALRGLDWTEVLIVSVGIPAALAMSLLQSVLLAEGRMVAYNAVEFSFALLTFVGLVVGLAIFSIGVTGAILLMVGLNVASAMTYFILVRRHSPPLRAPDRRLMAQMLRYAFRIYVTTLIAYAVGRVNLILVNSFLGSSAAGQYSVGLAVSDGLHLLPSVVALNLFPRIARGEGDERSAEVFRTLVLVYGVVCLITVPLAGPGLRLLYGPAFSPAVAIYYWMLPGIWAYGLINVLAYHFAGHGFPREAMLVWFPGLVLNLVIVFAFVPSGSANTAALAATLAYMLILVLHMRMFARQGQGYRELLPRPRETWDLCVGAVRSLRPGSA